MRQKHPKSPKKGAFDHDFFLKKMHKNGKKEYFYAIFLTTIEDTL